MTATVTLKLFSPSVKKPEFGVSDILPFVWILSVTDFVILEEIKKEMKK